MELNTSVNIQCKNCGSYHCKVSLDDLPLTYDGPAHINCPECGNEMPVTVYETVHLLSNIVRDLCHEISELRNAITDYEERDE